MDITNGVMFEDPVDMLIYLDDDLIAGKYDLYPWQIKVMQDFAKESSDKDPYQAVLRAANGSGKDKMILAPCAAWLAMRYPEATSVVTSASGTQLDRQTNAYIEKLAISANNKIAPNLWKINYRHYEVNFPGVEGSPPRVSTMELFVTDESGRAEGWHPKTYNGQLGIFTSEAKSIPDEIFHALARCTGFTKRLDVSTPGPPMGHFFNRCTGDGWTKYHVTAYECPHISRKYIEQCAIDYGGYTSALFKSMVLGEFGSTDDMVVIPYHQVYRCINDSQVDWFREDFNTAGLDLSAGGDETVLVVRNGNKVIDIHGFKFDDTTRTVEHLHKLFKDCQLNHPNSRIFGDAGGLGKPILDDLKTRCGWHNIRYITNQSSAHDDRAYHNRGTEMWFNMGRLVEMGEPILPQDERLKRQLATRYYKQKEGTNKLLLESKLQARAKGHLSPDRADALVLAFSNYKSRLEDEKTLPEAERHLPKRLPIPEPPPVFTLKEHAKRQSQSPDEITKIEQRQREYYGDPAQRFSGQIELQRLIQEHNDRIKHSKPIKEGMIVSP